MASARKASRSAMGFLNLWTTDPGTFPVVICAGIAAAGAATNAGRYLLNHPDVCFAKDRRENSMHYTQEEGADWRARRFRFANYSRNPINQSRQFDKLYERDENKSVRR
ncbi:hypothetical protein Poli38472_004688 [Pythium oligandrum]|uniref:NADH-ubiquinone reductase complex 1 MLRQ subunit n=1 Tax=Pythium oligandrum TaxID=41045 RepID=A0A8K1CAC2_PYTOL|nr:hypothetical protein Poli38472_004685 [Pythium oligandrum]TMW59617.1 hypothetical protein Poli38472_004686 [Pythium oligandrum]TMW59619.1 hypothetical protein Poli38472_004688 [Pythium oligandrum]|eukprot:TMW59616.1 hypothetical protein Poli38472_004685 [Pythium oligandrum]